MPLTDLQRRWLEAFLGEAEGNPTKAARLAGYGDYADNLAAMGRRNLREVPAIRRVLVLFAIDHPGFADWEERRQFWTRVMRDEECTMQDRLKASELLSTLLSWESS